jgi:hypothetical protein
MRKLIALALIGGLLAGANLPAEAKKRKKKKKPPACAEFVPGGNGAGQPTVVLTDAATEAAPVEQAVTLDPSVADLTQGVTSASYAYFNVQVDSAAPEAGLYALFEFPDRRDYDLYLRHPDGSEAASSHGFNPVAEVSQQNLNNTESNHGGETTAGSEALIGIKTPDCGGWTVEAQNWLGEGGEMTIKLWLGPVQIDPVPQGERPPA